MNKRKIYDFIRNFFTYFASIISVVVLGSIIVYVISNGFKYLSVDFIKNNYHESITTVSIDNVSGTYTDPHIDGTIFSKKYGISVKDISDENQKSVEIVYIASNSPFNYLQEIKKESLYKASVGDQLGILITDGNYVDSTYQASEFIKVLDEDNKIISLQLIKPGGGIRGSLIATLYLILFTLLFSLFIGIGASIYFVMYAKENKFKRILETLVNITSGIPSIIFGFVGLLMFVPLVKAVTGKEDYSILAGSLTMTIMLLPVIIKTTSEALLNVPKSYEEASLALGASKTQTVFKIILPNALPGILTAILLSVGRIIGESAAIMFVMGTQIEDNVNVLKPATTLSLHIWSLTKEEVPRYGESCAISILILFLIILLSVIVKIISYRINKKKGLSANGN